MIALLVGACSGGELDLAPPAPAPAMQAQPPADEGGSGTRLAMDFALAGGFWSAPFPSDARVHADGSVDVDAFPDPTDNPLVHRLHGMLAGERGFATTAAIFFSADAPLADAGLPDVHATVAKGSPIFVVSVDESASDHGVRYPVSARFDIDGGPFGAPNLLTLLPVQGIPLRPKTTYAAVVMRDLLDASRASLAVSPSLAKLRKGERPAGMSDAAFLTHGRALAGLSALGVDVARIAGLTVFTTGDPTAPLERVLGDARARPTPKPLAPFVTDEVFPDFCVFHTSVKMPVYQTGTPPYDSEGGAWSFDAAGTPILDHEDEARIVVTIPRQAMPSAGYPAVIMSRTGGGGDRPLVDRGPQPATGKDALAPGTGPALHFARAGFAGVSIDGPLGGPFRNPKMLDEQFSVFNVANPPALRDNVRQSAVELALAAHVLDELAIDVASCPGASGPARFDAGMTALMGHSMGATISPLAIAFEPRFRALLLSGAGGSWIENVIDKKHPIAVRGVAEVLLGLTKLGYHLHEHDPILSMFQWALEGADPPIYGRSIVRSPPAGAAPRSVLMMQGIVDHYILPSIANATSLSIGLDLADGSLDAATPELASFTPLATLLDLVDRAPRALPVAGNVAGATAVVIQYREDGLEDGHEVVFQTDSPKKQYRCFLASLRAGLPRVPVRGAVDDACD